MKDFALTYNLGVLEMDFTSGDALKNNILLSIHVAKGSCFWNLDFGSRLHTIKKMTADNLLLAKSYCEECLKWLLDIGRIRQVVVLVERDADVPQRANIAIAVTKEDGNDVTYSTFYAVV